jgi:DME family drug/metabolite transporter
MRSRPAHLFVLAAALLWASAGAATAIPVATAAAAMALFQLAFFAALRDAGVAATAFLSGAAAPLAAGAVAAARARRRPPRAWLAAFMFTAGGALCFAASASSLAAPALALASGLCYALYTLAATRLEAATPAAGTATTAVALLASSAVVLPLAARHLGCLAAPRNLAVALWLGLACTALAYRLYTAALRRLAPQRTLALLLFEPFAAAALGVALGEHIRATTLAGMAMIALAALVQLRAAPDLSQPTP